MSKKNNPYKASGVNLPKPVIQKVEVAVPPVKPVSIENPPIQNSRVKPEHSSLQAYAHIQGYLGDRSKLLKEEVNSILRLSQHLRVFGLLSAVGYLNQGKDSGEVAKRTKPIWTSLLGQMIDSGRTLTNEELMKEVQKMASGDYRSYMALWRKALVLSNHWNFWAKAHEGEK